VYRLRKNHDFVFVLSQGYHLDRDNPRTSYIGHVDGDNTVTLTDLKDVTERNTGSRLFPELFIQDIADPHVHITSYDPDHIWVSWVCGLFNHICAIRSDDGGKSFNDETFLIEEATESLHSTHEPSMMCNSETDCLLTWGETLRRRTFHLYAKRYTGNGWCFVGENQRIGHRLGISMEMSTAMGDSRYLVSGVDCLRSCLKPTTLSSANLTYTDNECHAEVDDVTVIDTDFVAAAEAAGGFAYRGAAGNMAPRSRIPSSPTWQIYSSAFELTAIRRNSEGRIDASATFGDPDPQISVMAGNVDFDGERFFVFYHRFYGLDHPEHPNSYSVCYRSTEDPHSLNWNEESCPVEHSPGLTARKSKFQNLIQPVGSAWHGDMSVIFQKDCSLDACTLALKRLENDYFSSTHR
jgi:hypothetical protein